MAAPSYFRRFWSDNASTDAYENCEAYLSDVAAWMRTVAEWLVEQGCDYIQLDAPNYGSLCDPANRVFHAEQGHDLDAELVFDAKLDSSICEGLDVTSALHICRGNGPGGRPHSAGSYDAIAELMFPNIDFDVALLEYDSDRSGDLGPVQYVKPGTVAVLGLLTTKAGELEPRGELEDRIKEAVGVQAARGARHLDPVRFRVRGERADDDRAARSQAGPGHHGREGRLGKRLEDAAKSCEGASHSESGRFQHVRRRPARAHRNPNRVDSSTWYRWEVPLRLHSQKPLTYSYASGITVRLSL